MNHGVVVACREPRSGGGVSWTMEWWWRVVNHGVVVACRGPWSGGGVS